MIYFFHIFIVYFSVVLRIFLVIKIWHRVRDSLAVVHLFVFVLLY